MKKLLFVIALLLIVGWIVGSFVYHIASALIHLLLIIAIVMIVLGLIKRKG
ncbi:lmo0937 family membrane protein [Flavobacterium litorale]|uniref:Lmo0937 family membrane protein n=1 Tax=Flavobacterium litorale TaxID=2856519 RepID=A0ABX8V5K5_9FLAO|nr:lmo0937 family membrane protein [Flavobacterium litorale]QYJ68116.1 lmo0937 family membrane protein [Flavobacterium litorale]